MGKVKVEYFLQNWPQALDRNNRNLPQQHVWQDSAVIVDQMNRHTTSEYQN